MEFNELMKEFGAAIGLEDFAPDEEGYCEIRSDETVFTFQNCPEYGVVLLTAPVCDIEPDEDPAFLRAALEANCMFEETLGSTLSIDRKTGALMLCRYDRLDGLDAATYVKSFEAFAGVLLKWRERHGAPAAGESAVGTAPVDFSGLALRV